MIQHRLLRAALLWLATATCAFAQSSPNLSYGQVPTAGQWNSYFAAKQDFLGYTPVNRAGDVMLGTLRTAPSLTSGSGFNVSPGVAPTSTNDGDFWVTPSGFFVQAAGVVYNLAGGPVGCGQLPALTGGVTSTSGSCATSITPSAVSPALDAAFGSTRGSLLVRGASGWNVQVPSAAGQVATFNGTDTVFSPSASSLVPNISNYSNLKITNGGSPNSRITIAADTLTLKGASAGLPLSGINVTAVTGISGANGLDTGTLAASTGYYVWVISNGTTTAALLSLSATAPTMPSGYTYKMRVGWTATDASSNLYRITQIGRRAQYVVTAGTNTAALPQPISGAQGSTSTPTYVAASLSALVPATATSVFGGLGGAGNCILAPNANYGAYNSATNPPPVALSSGGGTASFSFLLESPNLYYAGVSTCYVVILGWEDAI